MTAGTPSPRTSTESQRPTGPTGFLLEHDEYGDEAASVIVDQDGRLLLEDVYNGFDDLLEAGWAVTDGE